MSEENKEKLYIYIVIGAVVVAILVSIIYIWSTLFKSVKYKNINSYDPAITYEKKLGNYYSNYLRENLSLLKFEKIYSMISKDYLKSVGLENSDVDALKYYLRDKKILSASNANPILSTFASFEGKNYFRFKYLVGNDYKYVNIVEYDPYDFEISFEQSNLSTILKTKSVTKSYDSVEYKFEVANATNYSVSYDLTITNNSDKIYKYDFESLNHAQLMYNDSEVVNIAANALSPTVDYEIMPGSSKTINLLYNIEDKNQFLISGFKFTNVKIGNESGQTILIKF